MLDLYLTKPNVERDRTLIHRLLSRKEEFQFEGIETSGVLENAVQLYCRLQLEISLLLGLLNQMLLRGISVPDSDRIQNLLTRYLNNPTHFVDQLTHTKRHVPNVLDLDFAETIRCRSFFALAQHHGIPTRLLDWTISPTIAAFFAAEDALKNNNTLDHLTVFAVNQELLHQRKIINWAFPKSDNPYLYAQKGELTLHSGSSHFLWNGDFPSVDYLLEQGSDWSQEIQPIKITLPISEAPKLLRMLSLHEGISRDQLMPTLDNIAYVVKQRFELDLSE